MGIYKKIHNFYTIKLIFRQFHLLMGWSFSPSFSQNYGFFTNKLFLGLLLFFMHHTLVFFSCGVAFFPTDFFFLIKRPNWICLPKSKYEFSIVIINFIEDLTKPIMCIVSNQSISIDYSRMKIKLALFQKNALNGWHLTEIDNGYY